jgi:hypothetical protein
LGNFSASSGHGLLLPFFDDLPRPGLWQIFVIDLGKAGLRQVVDAPFSRPTHRGVPDAELAYGEVAVLLVLLLEME